MPTSSIRLTLYVALLAISALLSTPFELVTNPKCGAVGEGRPWIPDPENPGQLKQISGDYYNRTKCYCRRLEGTPDDTVWDGAYFHISYYSNSQSRRFDLEWTCKAWWGDRDSEWGDTVCAAKQNMENFWRPGEFRYVGCADCGDPNSLKWCYSAQRQAQNRDESILWIRNKPKSVYVNEFGTNFSPYWIELHDECDKLCKEKVDPLTGCLYWAINWKFPVAVNTIDYVDDVFELK